MIRIYSESFLGSLEQEKATLVPEALPFFIFQAYHKMHDNYSNVACQRQSLNIEEDI